MDTRTIEAYSNAIFGLIIGLIVGVAAGFYVHKAYFTPKFDESVSTRKTVSKSVAPTPTQERTVKYVKVPVETNEHVGKTALSIIYVPKYIEKVSDSTSFDSAYIPITQKEYRDSNYTAWVSGYEPRLDSIYVMSRTTTITKTARRFRRWNIGISGGYGYGILSKRFEPYIGLGVTVNLLK